MCSSDLTASYALENGSFKIKLHGPASTATPVPKHVKIGSLDICFETDEDLVDLIKYFEDHNIPIVCGPVTRTGYKGAMTSVYVNDPDGNLLEFSKYEK